MLFFAQPPDPVEFPAFANVAAVRTVRIADIAFKPSRITVRRGTTVRWKFADGLTHHNVHSRGKLRFKSSRDKLTGTHSVKFRKTGRYDYVCTIHPLAMRGVVTVRR